MENVKPKSKYYFFLFMEQVIAEMRNIGRIRTSETYATTNTSPDQEKIDIAVDGVVDNWA